jgi:hypothetical protein
LRTALCRACKCWFSIPEKKYMRNTLRTYVVSSLIAVMTINPAWACHGCGGWGGGYGGPVYYGSSNYGGGCCGGWSGCCGGYEVVSECESCQSCGECSSCGSVTSERPSDASSHRSSQSPSKMDSQPTMAAPPAVQPEMPNPPQQPAKVERPVDNTPAPTLPSTQAPAQPQVPLPNSESNPPAPGSSDLFNSAPTPPPAAPPAEKPAETPAATPASPPAAKPAGDDLFGAPAAEKPATAAEKPADKPAATPPAAESKPAAGDDLFGAPAADKAAPPAEKPADKPAGEEKKDEKKSDDIFGSSSSVLHEVGGLASNETRQWVDNTGNFSCQARLVRLVDGQVQLLKDNGHTTTVRLSRLSANDLRFVERQASAQHGTAFQTAQSTSEMPWITN